MDGQLLELLRTGPWDGVLMDETNSTPRFDLGVGRSLAKYPTDAAYQQAMGTMVAYAGSRITGVGKLAIANIGSWSEYPATAESWLRSLSGGMDEDFTKWAPGVGEGYRGPRGWQTQLEEVQSTERLGKRFLAVTQAEPTDIQAIRYGWATALLGGAEHTDFFAASSYDGDPWSSEYEVALGDPVAPAEALSNGAWRGTSATVSLS